MRQKNAMAPGKMTSGKITGGKKFTFTSVNKEKLDKEIAQYPAGKEASALLAALHLGQEQNGGWLSLEVMDHVAAILNLPLAKVYEVANFYSLFYTTPVGKHVIQVCDSAPCWLRGSHHIIKACQKWLGIQENETTADHAFTLKTVECLGACIHAPAVQINETYYENLDAAKMTEILEHLAEGSTDPKNVTK